MKYEEKEAAEKYNTMGKFYHDLRVNKHRGGWFYNELLEMPAMLSLLGNVRGKRSWILVVVLGFTLSSLQKKVQ